jgi:hypothetical protein
MFCRRTGVFTAWYPAAKVACLSRNCRTEHHAVNTDFPSYGMILLRIPAVKENPAWASRTTMLDLLPVTHAKRTTGSACP